MEVSNDLKQRVLQAIKADRDNFPSDSKHAVSLGINKAIYSQIMKGSIERKLKDGEWIRIGRKLNVSLGNRAQWITANTPVYKYITKQLTHCQEESTTGIFCDKAGIGKTHTAKEYARTQRHAVYMDCSENKTKSRFIRALAQQFGIEAAGRLIDVVADLVYYVKTLDRPLIILDEAGDLEYSAWLELKSLYNQMEDACGWYMMGADGLAAKIERHIAGRKVGYAEIFDRYGADFQRLVPKDEGTATQFFRHQAEMILAANMGNHPAGKELLLSCKNSLRRLKKEIIKLKKAA